MEATTVFGSDNKLISLDNKNCSLSKDKRKVTCTKVTSCLKYAGINLPPTIDIDISWVLDAKKTKNPRMFFLHDEGKNIINSTMRLYRGKSECRTDTVYIDEDPQKRSPFDKLTPLEVEMKYNVRETVTKYSASTQSRVRRNVLEPVLDENRGLNQHNEELRKR
jgi:integrin alpha 8